MEKIREAFRRHFAGFGLELPEPLPEAGALGAGGWAIRYVVRPDEQGRPYLELTAEHRASGMSHLRITGDGAVHELDTFQDYASHDPQAGEDEQDGRRRMEQHNERVREELRRQGLL